MKIQKIDNTNFGAKKFGVLVKAKRHKHSNNKSVIIRTVSGKRLNPDARNSMGQSELNDISIINRLRNWYESNILKRILKDEW